MAVSFNASGQHYTSTASLPTGNFTMLAWVLVSVDRNTAQGFLNFDATTNGYFLGTGNDGTTPEINSAAGDIIGAALAVGTWCRVAATINGSTGTLYQGEAGASALSNFSGTVSTGLTLASFAVGTGGPSLGSWLNGRVANVKHYSALLTAAEITTELSQYVPVRTANLVRWHPFIGAGTADSSGNGNTLTPAGAGAATADGPPIPWTGYPSLRPPVPRRRAANL